MRNEFSKIFEERYRTWFSRGLHQRFSRKYQNKRSRFKTKYPVILIRSSKRPSFQGHLLIDCGSLSESWFLTLNLQDSLCKKQIDHLSTMNEILKRSLCHIMPIWSMLKHIKTRRSPSELKYNAYKIRNFSLSSFQSSSSL